VAGFNGSSAAEAEQRRKKKGMQLEKGDAARDFSAIIENTGTSL
jgi:hypothetical protein